jgi:hypothetical protein
MNNRAKRTLDKALRAVVRADVAANRESILAADIPFLLMAASAAAVAKRFNWDSGAVNKRYGRATAALKREAGLNKAKDRVLLPRNPAGAHTAASFDYL